jgi:Domain of unknown function (DUF4157)
MEASFGTSFRDVRVHTDPQANMLNRRLTARAFTTGNDIFLRGDASPADGRLLAHELSHVVQQRSMSAGGGGMHVGAAGDAHESHADAAAGALASAGSAQRQADEEELQASHDLTQRQADEDEVQALHDLTQRQADEDEVQALHDLTQRQADEDEVQASHDLTQRQAEEEEPSS